MTNRESICKQQMHCLSCPLSVGRTGKPCDKLTQKEVLQMIVKETDSICVCCGAVIPEGRQVCPSCGASEGKLFEKAMSRIIPTAEKEFKVDDVREQSFRQGYTTGFTEGMKNACEIKQENERLKRRIIILEQQASNTVHDIDAEYE